MCDMERVTTKLSKDANRYLLELSLKLSKKGKRVYVGDIIDETCKRLKSGEWSLDTMSV